jgi:branched-chain amino acid transport system permease protein
MSVPVTTEPLPEVTVVRRTLASVGAAVALAVALGVLTAAPWWASEGQTRDLVEFLTLLALAQMWNLLAGYAGLVSIGQQAFIGVGAYGLYMLGDKGGVHPFAAVALAGLVAAGLSLPTALLAFRLRGGYFAIGTWVIAEVYRLVTINGTDFGFDVGGGDGVTILSAAGLDRDFRADGTYWWALAVGAGSVLLTYAILRSRIGLALTAIRDDETAAGSLGINVLRTKVAVYVIAAFGFGLAGAVIYLNLLRVQPDAAYDVNWTAYMIFIVVIGGIGTIEGPIIGAIIFFTLQQEFSQYGVWYLILLGSVAVAFAVWVRGGIWGVLGRFGVHLFPVRRRVRVSRPAAASTPSDAPSRP